MQYGEKSYLAVPSDCIEAKTNTPREDVKEGRPGVAFNHATDGR